MTAPTLGNFRDEPHYVYRCFDADARLVYIGCTVDVQARMVSHRAERKARASLWLRTCMASYSVAGPYRGRAAALRAESAAIVAERPLFNLHHGRQPSWAVLGDVARYLVENGHGSLAASTACTCWRESRDVGARDPWCHAHNEAFVDGLVDA